MRRRSRLEVARSSGRRKGKREMWRINSGLWVVEVEVEVEAEEEEEVVVVVVVG